MLFDELFNLHPELDLSITIKRKNDRLTVHAIPTSDCGLFAKIITGSPEDLDEGFIKAITTPPPAGQGLQVSDDESVAKGAERCVDKKGTKPKPAVKKHETSGSDDEADGPAETKPKEPSLFD